MAYVPKVNPLMGNAPAPQAAPRYTPKANVLMDPGLDPADYAAKHPAPKAPTGLVSQGNLPRISTDTGGGLNMSDIYAAAERGGIRSANGPAPDDFWGQLAYHAGNLISDYTPGLKQTTGAVEQLTGAQAAKGKQIDTGLQTGALKPLQAFLMRQDLIHNNEWAGVKDSKGNTSYNVSPGDNIKKAAGVALQATADIAPIPGIKGATIARKAGSGVLQGLVAGGLHAAGAGLVDKGSVDAGEVAKGAAVGGALGGGLGLAGGLLGKLGGKGKADAFNAYHEAAVAQHDGFHASLKGVADQLGTTHVVGPVKTAARIKEKAVNDYGGDVTKVQDAVRGSLHLNDPAQIGQYVKTIGKSYQIDRVKNGYENAGPGYKDVKVNVKLPNGTNGEIILATPEMTHAKEVLGGHLLYEKVRAGEGDVTAYKAQMDKLYSEADKAAAARVNSSSVTGLPSDKALPIGKGLPKELNPATSPPSLTSLTGTSSTKKNAGYLIPSIKSQQGEIGNAANAAETVGKDSGLTINAKLEAPKIPESAQPSAPGENWSSRVKQYEQHLQEAIKNTEESPAYQGALRGSGGEKVIGNTEVYNKAKQLGPLSDAEIASAKSGGKVDAVHVVRAKATLNQAAQEFTDMWKAGKTDQATVSAAADRLAKLEAGYKVISAGPGRALQIQNSFIDKSYQLQQKLADLERTTKGPNKRQVIEEELKKAEEELQNQGMNPSVARKWVDMFTEYATAAKLTSPLTHFVNVASNLLTMPVKAAEDLVKIGLRVPQGKTGLGQAKYVFGTGKGLVNATKQLGADLKATFKGKSPDDLAGGKSEIRPGAIPGKLGNVIRTPFNFLSAADGFFKNLFRDRELHQAAYAQAWREGNRAGALKNRVDELVKSPTEDMAARAEGIAKEFTFNNDPGRLANGVIKILSDVPLMRLLVPFVRTPVNIAQFQFRRSGAGLFSPKNISDLIGKGSTGASREDAIARIAVGGSLSIAGAMAAINMGDDITGAAPVDPGQKDAFYSQGKKPYSIKIGGNWVQYNRFQPVGMYLTQAVGLRDALMSGNSKTAGDVFSSFAVTTAKGLADLPFVTGVSNVISALNDPSNLTTANKAISGVLGGLIPNVSRDIAAAGDNVQRKPQSIGDQLKMYVPGLRQQVAGQTNTFGQPGATPSDDPFTRGFIKIVSKDRPNALFDALKAANYSPGPPPQKQRGQQLDKQTYVKFQVRSGTLFAERVQKAIDDPQYQALPADRQQKALSVALNDSRTQALDELLGKAKPKAPSPPVKRYK